MSVSEPLHTKKSDIESILRCQHRDVDAEHATQLPEPRAYRLPYSEKLHGQVISALDSARSGTRQLGTVTGRSGSGPGKQRGVNIRFDDFRGRGLPPKRKR